MYTPATHKLKIGNNPKKIPIIRNGNALLSTFIYASVYAFTLSSYNSFANASASFIFMTNLFFTIFCKIVFIAISFCFVSSFALETLAENFF